MHKRDKPTHKISIPFPVFILVILMLLSACDEKLSGTTSVSPESPHTENTTTFSDSDHEPWTPSTTNNQNDETYTPEPEQPVLTTLSYDEPEVILAPGTEYKPVLTYQYRPNLADAAPPELFYESSTETVEVSEDGSIRISENAVVGSEAIITARSEDVEAHLRIHVRYSASDTLTEPNADGIAVVTNPDHVVVFVNKQRSLPDGYEPDHLVQPDVPFSFEGESEKKLMQEPAARALEQLFAQAEADGITLRAVSGYRSYATQKFLFNYYIETYGEEYAHRYSAFPGTSEHQTGLAMDVSSPSVNNQLTDEFGSTEEGKWLQENCANFGFIIRYPNGKEHITGYAYEPWHLRYVGEELAKLIMSSGSTLEEYFDDSLPVFADNLD